MGTDDDTLIQIVVSRCEVDMVEIKTEFEKTYGKSLEKFIKVKFTGCCTSQWALLSYSLFNYATLQDDTSGSYKEALIALIGGKV